jgi:hypothetical protein
VLLAFVARHRVWSWAGMTPFRFAPGGKLETPWGGGAWGLAGAGGGAGAGAAGNALYVEFAGARMVLEFEPDAGQPFGMFISQRCADGDLVVGRMADPK